jgi:rod shape-determining protein MreC
MARNPRPIMRIASPVRAWAHRFTYVLLVGGAFALMLLGKTDAVLVERLRTTVTDALSPIMTAVERPVAAFENGVENAKNLFSLRQQNAELLAQRDALAMAGRAAWKPKTRSCGRCSRWLPTPGSST